MEAPLTRPKLALQAFTPESLVDRFPEIRPLEARRLLSAVFRGEWTYSPMHEVRRTTAEFLARSTHLPSLTVHQVARSAEDPFIKLAVSGADARIFETVRIPLEKAGRFVACVSSQVGCALACAFCATGRMGLLRNLETWEIVDQVQVLRRELGARMHGVVFQGMGEPMANLDRVLEAIRVLRHPCCGSLDARNMTVCTSGLPSGILRLAEQAPKVRLGVSIGSALPEKRRTIMPIDSVHPLHLVVDACAEHASRTRLSPLWAVTLLAGVNDSSDDAEALAELASAFALRTGIRPRLSIIPYNSLGANDPFARSGNEASFRAVLRARGVGSHFRYSGGQDIGAACGQLSS